VAPVTCSATARQRSARTALVNTVTEYPYKLDQVLGAVEDLASPRALHPAFWGSYDWHSCVHMHWTLARLLRRFPDHLLAGQSRAHFGSRLTTTAVAQEILTLRGPHRQTFERPYGWGWLLKLAAELELLTRDQPDASPWRDAVRPLAAEFADRFLAYLPKADYPTRAGTHANSAFALLLALDWCDAVQHRALRRAIGERANRWFGRDRRYPAGYEPGGEDFLAAGLVEAALMLKVIDGCSFPTGGSSSARPMMRWSMVIPVTVNTRRMPSFLRTQPVARLVLAAASRSTTGVAARCRGLGDQTAPRRLIARRDERRLCRHALAGFVRAARARRPFNRLTDGIGPDRLAAVDQHQPAGIATRV
jgi:hypothetical protein